ncbi:MAG TPA: class I SAM-dependent methyltransferase family protein [Candidatus Bathyarchaeia archaeon]|nr:class I SAM-dependent methyltransferase family protein [Candidatus Bathyarchaeia archaeon]
MSRSETESAIEQESFSLQIPKKKGQTAIQLLTTLSLLNRRLAPQTVDNILHIPLSRKPLAEDQRRLQRELGELALSHERFPSRTQGAISLDEALSQTLPSNIASVVSKSFDIIGDIAIIELSAKSKPFERIIADALMKVHKNIKAVYSKDGPISDIQRLRPLHHILGTNRTETIHKELGCRFKIDISKAFFSPRLSTEHSRVAEQVRPGECVVDMFAGVGPFSILIAKRLKDIRVHAIDANPDAVKLANENVRLNKVQGRITVWAGDARVIVKNNLSGAATRVIMNHPSHAREFLEEACQALRREGGIVHYYTFADGPNSESKASKEFVDGIRDFGWKIERIVETRKVRGVAPVKWQVAVDARLELA